MSFRCFISVENEILFNHRWLFLAYDFPAGGCVEGTRSYGVGLPRTLAAAGLPVRRLLRLPRLLRLNDRTELATLLHSH